MEEDSLRLAEFLGNMTIILGDGGQTCFKHDICCADKTLCPLFPYVYNVKRENHVLVRELWKEGVTRGVWKIHFN